MMLRILDMNFKLKYMVTCQYHHHSDPQWYMDRVELRNNNRLDIIGIICRHMGVKV